MAAGGLVEQLISEIRLQVQIAKMKGNKIKARILTPGRTAAAVATLCPRLREIT